MRIIDLFKRNQSGKKVSSLATEPDGCELYKLLDQEFYTKYEYGWRREDKGEGMAVISRLVIDYWKPRYLLDTRAHKAYEMMSPDLKLLTIRDDDIDWDSLKTLSSDLIAKVHLREAFFPTMIRRFCNGTAELEWQINPDGRYYMDEDGFGMTDDEEVALIGKIDRNGRVVEKLRYNP